MSSTPMNVVVCESPGNLVLAARSVPVRGADEVLLRIRRVGICGTDMHIVRGTQPYLSYPRVMGHELAAEVVDAGSDPALKAGDIVFVMPYMSCGKCNACAKGRSNCCANLQVLGVHRDGGLAQYVSVPARFVRKAEGLTLDQTAMIEFLSIGAHAVERAALQAGERILVTGAGPIGLAVSLFAALKGVQITVMDTRSDRLEFCRDVIGVQQTVVAGPQAASELLSLTDGQMFDAVFDATGNPAAMRAGFAYVAQAGRYVLVSIVNAEISFSDPEFHRREMTLLGSRNATFEDVERVMEAMRAGLIPTERLASHRARLEQLPEVMPLWMQPDTGVVKALVEC